MSKEREARPQFAIKSGIRLTLLSVYSPMGPKKISLSAKGTFAPHEITSKLLLIITSICSLVTNLVKSHSF